MTEIKEFSDNAQGQDEPQPKRKKLTPQEEPEMSNAMLEKMTKQSGKKPKVQIIEIGETVCCDWCGKDFTDSDVKGGLLFGSKACCPECEPGIIEGAKKYNEGSFIKGYCPDGMEFRKWAIGLRDGE